MSQYKNIAESTNERYYRIAEEVSEDIFANQGFVEIYKHMEGAKRTLEIGCGSGIKTFKLSRSGQEAYGCDINSYSIDRAQKQYPSLHFFVSEGQQIQFPDGYFDFVYSSFVLEHVDKPKKFIDEMARLVAPGGHMAIICPNFGSPLFPSPPTRYRKNILGKMTLVCQRIIEWFRGQQHKDNNELQFKKVSPIIDAPYQTDHDTTNEPEIKRLDMFLRQKGFESVFVSSLWSTLHPRNVNDFMISLFKLVAGVPPVKYWGPQICIIMKKP